MKRKLLYALCACLALNWQVKDIQKEYALSAKKQSGNQSTAAIKKA